MARETIQAILKAEEKAAQIEKDAIAQGEEVVQKAKEDAKLLIANMTKLKLLQSESDLKNVYVQNEKYMEEAIVKAEKDIVMIKEIVKNKEQLAISQVLVNLL